MPNHGDGLGLVVAGLLIVIGLMAFLAGQASRSCAYRIEIPYAGWGERMIPELPAP